MRRSQADFLRLIWRILPPGTVFNKKEDSWEGRFFGAIAAIAATFHGRKEDLIDETDPTKTSEMLPDFESVYGLPEFGQPVPPTEDERRAVLLAKWRFKGSQCETFWIAYAAEMGVTITIVKHFPTYAETSYCEDILYDDFWRWIWEVHYPAATPNIDVLKVAMETYKGAETRIMWVPV